MQAVVKRQQRERNKEEVIASPGRFLLPPPEVKIWDAKFFATSRDVADVDMYTAYIGVFKLIVFRVVDPHICKVPL